jgi:hypothetical protein
MLFFFPFVPLALFFWVILLAHCQAAKKYFDISPSHYIQRHLFVYQVAARSLNSGGADIPRSLSLSDYYCIPFLHCLARRAKPAARGQRVARDTALCCQQRHTK